MSQPPHYSDPQGPYSGQPSSGGPQGHPPPTQGGYPPQPGQGGYPPQPNQSGYPAQPAQGAYPAQPAQGGYPPQPSQGGYPPQPDQSGYPPQPGQGGYPSAGHEGSAGQPGFSPPGGALQPGGAPHYGNAPQQYGGAPQYSAGPEFGGPARQKSSVVKIALIAVAVVAVLCVGAGTAVLLATKDKVGGVVAAASITVVEPDTLGGRAKIEDPGITAAISAPLAAGMRKVPGATKSVAGLYGDERARDVVMMGAAASITGSPEERLDDFLSGMYATGSGTDVFTEIDPGPLGGIAKCGNKPASTGATMSVCVWSDHGSFGMLSMLFQDRVALEKEFISMRGQIELKD